MLRMMVVHQWTIPCKAAVNLDFVTASLSCILLGILSLDRTIHEDKVKLSKFTTETGIHLRVSRVCILSREWVF